MKKLYHLKVVYAHEIQPDTYIFDVAKSGKILGRIATEIAKYLMGKYKANFASNMLCGDKVIVINANQIEVTGNKKYNKLYRHHTGYELKQINYKDQFAKDPCWILERAIYGMLPKNKLRSRIMAERLKIYVNDIINQEDKIND